MCVTAEYLAASGCESTVVTFIEEMPGLQFYVPRQPVGVSKSDFVRMLGRPSLTPTLNDVLNDYGRSKMLGMLLIRAIISQLNRSSNVQRL